MNIISLLCLLIFSVSIYANDLTMTPDEAMELIKIHQTFPEKGIKNTPSLCEFHKELVEVAQKKYKLEPFTCSNRQEGSQTKDHELSEQLKKIDNVVQISDAMRGSEFDSETEQFLNQAIVNLPKRK